MRYTALLVAALLASTEAKLCDDLTGEYLSPVCLNGFTSNGSGTFHAAGDNVGGGKVAEQGWWTEKQIYDYLLGLPTQSLQSLADGNYHIPGLCQATTVAGGSVPTARPGAAAPPNGQGALTENNAKVIVCHNIKERGGPPRGIEVAIDSLGGQLNPTDAVQDRLFGAADASGNAFDCHQPCEEEEEEYDASPSPIPSPAASPSPSPKCDCSPCECCYEDPNDPFAAGKKQSQLTAAEADWVYAGCEKTSPVPGLPGCFGCKAGQTPPDTPRPSPPAPSASPSPSCSYPPGEILDTFCPNLDILYGCGICWIDENYNDCDGVITNVCPGHSPEEIEDYCTRENFSCGGGAP